MLVHDAFIFDLDGTLLDTLDDLTLAANTVLQQLGMPQRSRQEIRSFVGNGARRLMFLAAPTESSQASKEEALRLFFQVYPQQGYPNTQPYSGISQVLASLRQAGAGLAVLSNKFDAAVKGNIDRFLPGCFDVVHGECKQIPRKPTPEGMVYTMRELNSAPDRCVYVGDSPVDMETARKAGIYALGVSWGFNSVQDLLDAGAQGIANTPEDLLRLL